MEFKRTFNKESGAKQGLKLKQDFIKKSVDRKENSMRDFAIRRDSAMFATVSAQKTRESLEEEYKYWTLFFENQYSKQEEKPVEDDTKIVYEQNTN
jgi:hypothetical protein